MYLKVHSHMAKPDKATSMAPEARDTPTCPYQQQRKPSAATPTAHTFPGLVLLEAWALEGKGEDVTMGEGNLKKIGRNSHGTELGDMGTRARRPSGL